MSATALGLVAGALTTGAWLPQLFRTWRLRRAGEISWGYLGVFGTGVAGWLAYGIIVSSIAIVLTNAVTLALLVVLVVLKARVPREEL